MAIFDKFRARVRASDDPYRWMVGGLGDVHPLSWHDGEPVQTLIETDDGAILRWVFDIDLESEIHTVLLIHLTDEEVSRVLSEIGTRVGLIEPVRASLENPHALLMQTGSHGGVERYAMFEVPRLGSELAYVESMFSTAESGVKVGAATAEGNVKKVEQRLVRLAGPAIHATV